MYDIYLHGLEEDLIELERSVDTGVARAVGEIDRAVATEAKANHPYEDHTGRLTSSIAAGEITGSFVLGDLAGSVVATAPYASYLDDRTEPRTRQDGGFSPAFAFLQPAFDRLEQQFGSIIDRELREAIESAGWMAGG